MSILVICNGLGEFELRAAVQRPALPFRVTLRIFEFLKIET